MSTATTRTTQREPVAGHVRTDDFRHRAACRSVDVAVFFPTAVQGQEYERQVSVAKAVCAGCPVLPECLTWALFMSISARKRCFEQGIRVEDMSFSWPGATPTWSFCVKDTSGPDVHDGPESASGATSTTSKTGLGEIHITLSALSDGIAGGMTEHERRTELARRRVERRGDRLPKPRVPSRPVRGTRAEIATAGKAAIAAGLSVREAAGEFLVSPTTAARWARAVRSTDSTSASGTAGVAEGSAGCNRAPLLISHSKAQAGHERKDTDPR